MFTLMSDTVYRSRHSSSSIRPSLPVFKYRCRIYM